jgi:hypothetical protein
MSLLRANDDSTKPNQRDFSLLQNLRTQWDTHELNREMIGIEQNEILPVATPVEVFTSLATKLYA